MFSNMIDTIASLLLPSLSPSRRNLLEGYVDPPNRHYWQREMKHITTLSKGQQMALCLLPILPSLLSIICSSLLMWLIFKTWKKQTPTTTTTITTSTTATSSSTPYQRILFMFSICDIIASINLIIGPIMIPQETSYRYWALGNDTSCTIAGAFYQFGMSSHCYYCVLSFYFLCIVRYNIPQYTLAKYYEPIMHLVAIGYPSITAVIGICLDTYGEFNLGRGCWVYSKCDSNDICLTTRSYLGWIFGIPIFICVLATFVNNLLLYCHVRTTIYRGVRNAEQRSSFLQFTVDDGGNTSTTQQGRRRRSLSRTTASSSFTTTTSQTNRVREVASQAFLYTVAYLITVTISLICRILDGRLWEAVDEQRLYPILVLQSILLPLMGVFNFLIFLRPTYLRIRDNFPNETKVWSFQRSLFGPSILPNGRTTRNRDRENGKEASSTLSPRSTRAAAGSGILVQSNGSSSQHLGKAVVIADGAITAADPNNGTNCHHGHAMDEDNNNIQHPSYDSQSNTSIISCCSNGGGKVEAEEEEEDDLLSQEIDNLTLELLDITAEMTTIMTMPRPTSPASSTTTNTA